MFCGDGVAFCCHPILACVPTDYEEQILIAGVKKGLCPLCPTPCDEIGEGRNEYSLQDIRTVLNALSKANANPAQFKKAC